MLKDITLGQYFPGNTLAHRLDPRTKLMMVVIYIIALFCAKSFFSYGLLALFLLISVKISKVGFRALIRGMKPLIFILIFYCSAQYVLYAGAGHRHFLDFYADSGRRLGCGVYGNPDRAADHGHILMTYTTSPIVLTDAIENLLGPLKRLHVPVHELAMMMSIALRFIPTLIEETDKICPLQKARGADFETGNILRRASGAGADPGAAVHRAFRRADELATAMGMPLLHGGEAGQNFMCCVIRRRIFLHSADDVITGAW